MKHRRNVWLCTKVQGSPYTLCGNILHLQVLLMAVPDLNRGTLLQGRILPIRRCPWSYNGQGKCAILSRGSSLVPATIAPTVAIRIMAGPMLTPGSSRRSVEGQPAGKSSVLTRTQHNDIVVL